MSLLAEEDQNGHKVKEIESMELVEATPSGFDAKATPSEGPADTNAPQMSERQFTMNIIKMTVMWSATSFSCNLLTFMNKFLEGSIYTNSYAEGVAGALAALIGGKLYTRLGMRNMYLFSFTLAFIGGLFIYLLESRTLHLPPWYLSLFVDSSIDKAPKLAKIAFKRALDSIIPKLTFISKFGIQLAFLSTYTASFSNDRIFPAEKRTSAIGQCQFIGRLLTVLASEVTEMPQPLPILCFLGLIALAIAVSATFESEDNTPSETQQI